jgi:hypothetical protein
MDKVLYAKEQVLNFFSTTTSNIVGIGLGGALTALSLIDFSIVGLVAGVFLMVAEGIQYWERAN